MSMSALSDKRSITVVSACMTASGEPDFAITTVEVTEEEEANGHHYELADAQLLENDYEEPFVHFGDREAPPFLLPAVRQYLGLPASKSDETIPLIVEKPDGSHH
jgi:hypothetical protein